jgi:hypothetical protein
MTIIANAELETVTGGRFRATSSSPPIGRGMIDFSGVSRLNGPKIDRGMIDFSGVSRSAGPKIDRGMIDFTGQPARSAPELGRLLGGQPFKMTP